MLLDSISVVLTDWAARAARRVSRGHIFVAECDIRLSEHSCTTCRCTHSATARMACSAARGALQMARRGVTCAWWVARTATSGWAASGAMAAVAAAALIGRGQIEVAICATVAVWEVRDAIAEDDTTRAWATSTATTARRRILCAARQWHARTAVAAGLMAAGVAAAAPRGSERQAMPRALILILLYIGCVERNPGPSTAEAEGRRTLRVATMNAPGQHASLRCRVRVRRGR